MAADPPLHLAIAAWLGLFGAALAWGLALYIGLVGQHTRQVLFLMALLVVDGFAIVTGGVTGGWLRQDVGLAPTFIGAVHQASDWLLVGIYLPFVGMTVPSRLAGPLKNRRLQAGILTVSALVAISILLMPLSMRVALNRPFYVVVILALSWGFITALHAWKTAATETQRSQAKAFTIAFGVRDVLWIVAFSLSFVSYLGLSFVSYLGLSPEAFASIQPLTRITYPLAVVICVPLIVYGVLRAQLFDIDLRLKKTLRRSLIGATFVAAFYVVSELAALYLSDSLGNILGLVCTGALVFVLSPIQRAAERISDAAMPNTKSTPQYEAYRKLQVYESTLRAALEEGDISDRERRMLDRLVESLGIERGDADQLEIDLRSSVPGAA